MAARRVHVAHIAALGTKRQPVVENLSGLAHDPLAMSDLGYPQSQGNSGLHAHPAGQEQCSHSATYFPALVRRISFLFFIMASSVPAQRADGEIALPVSACSDLDVSNVLAHLIPYAIDRELLLD